MANYRVTESGNLEYFLYVGKDPKTGRYKKISKTFPNTRNGKKEAELWVAEKTIDVNNGIPVNPKKYKLKDYLRQWLADYAEVNLSPTTTDGYRTIIETHIIPALGELKLTEIQPQHIQTYQSDKLKHGNKKTGKGLSNTTVLQHHRVLSKALKQAVLLRLIPNNPCQPVPAPRKKRKEIGVLNTSQINQLLNMACDKDVYYFIVLAVYTGMRRSEILPLRWKDIDFNRKKLYVRRALVRKKGEGAVIKDIPKNNSSRRTIDISDTVVNTFKKLNALQNKCKLTYGDSYNYEDGDLIFCNDDGTRLSPDTPTHQMQRLVEGTELEGYTPHMLRHTHATLMLENGTAIKVVQERLGHSTSRTTNDIYVHATETMQKEAADMFDSIIK
ncbi:tyrosine-type recombinase/integrase [Halocella sp. SP3-1]|uniref:tyrosine-type recombinase/integrase n=1 Tax=Halocella sp. SP3-1 TaxID=2382161 RepID=UPI0013DF5D76|nr:tyrosine-type recombinase/integrase [Halocella sp. SP3-1]